MKKIYWVKKDPNNERNWIEMNGKQFYEFISSPEGKGRYFMDCETYELEITQEQYQEWKKEANHSGYLKQYEDEAEILSLEGIIENSEIYGEYGEEILADDSANTEDEAIRAIELELLSEAVLFLPDDERRLIVELFLRDKPRTEDEIAAIMGKTRQAVNKQKNKILKNLKMSVAKTEKSQQ